MKRLLMVVIAGVILGGATVPPIDPCPPGPTGPGGLPVPPGQSTLK